MVNNVLELIKKISHLNISWNNVNAASTCGRLVYYARIKLHLADIFKKQTLNKILKGSYVGTKRDVF